MKPLYRHAIVAALCALPLAATWADTPSLSASETTAIAKQAYLYGYPVVEMYKTLYAQAVDQGGADYKAEFNRIGNTARVFTPRDKAFVTPNSDTPYSFLWLDLRAEPQVLSLPAIEAQRYYSVQLIDLYTQNFDYLGTRTTGNQGGTFLIAGPHWQGPVPSGIAKAVHSESDIVYALYRTQLFDEADLAKVREIQAGYRVQPLSGYLGQPPAPKPAAIAWPRPQADMSDSPALFRYLSFMLAFAAPQPAEKDLLARLARIGVTPGGSFDEQRLSEGQRAALQAGIDAGKAEFAQFKKTRVDTHQISSSDLFGSRAHLQGNTLYRYAGANMGIFGNSAEEANYIGYFTDAQGRPANGASRDYRLHFAKDQLPPARAFWSLTMYDGATKLLVENPLQRYLINSRMLDSLARDADGGITLYLQPHSPGKARESNWLPTPAGPFYAVLRVYMPGPELASGQWRQPPLQSTDR
ncbi:DUF1254 domain-containing protein [Pseudomonas sp. HR96]|uniref:DUF1254 domain-containing protein n=1 Tax=Pseudomonas sp. HR96 TaxID=1027966 RepID=UPI002A74ACB9|nr:DUF1254 domain-containing protein [Pseudomonas sp. HR96]WPO98091.1 DUF1254 domain-containing protein [Pseudomonas sp. HR96]